MAKWTDEQKSQIDQMSGEGKSVRQIAEVTKISKSSVGLYLKKQKEETASVQEEPAEINFEDIIETQMISEGDANSFLSQLAPGVTIPPNSSVKPIGLPSKSSSFMNDILSTKVPVAEHITAPFKSKGRRASEPKTPKPRAEKALAFLDKIVKEKEDPSLKPDLIGKITFNVNTFETLLNDIIRGDKEAFLKSLDKMSVATLEATLKTIETTRSVKNLTNQFLHFFWVGTSLVEVGTQQFLGMKTQGFTQMLQQTQADELKLIMQELAMEQKETFKKVQRPEVRLAMIMTTSLLAINSQNNLVAMKQQQQQLQQQKQQNMPPVIQKTNTSNQPSRTEPTKVDIPGQAKISPVMPQETIEQFKEL